MSAITVQSAILRGIEAVPVEVQVAVERGIPGIAIAGNVDSELLESRYRVRCALHEAGFSLPHDKHIIVSFYPSETRATGRGLDLAIARGILAATGQIPADAVEGKLHVGEACLNGSVAPVRGMVAYERLAESMGLALECPEDLCSTGKAAGLLPAVVPPDPAALDFRDVIGYANVKRAAVISAAGKHPLLMIGPEGSGKTMIARRIPTILPEPTPEELQENALIASVAGLGQADGRPFRALHHSITIAGLIGGGRPVLPGEVTLAHNGVLFLDQLEEFPRAQLDALRAVMSDGEARIVRADGIYDFPADTLLVAAAKPCPCGHFGDPGAQCTDPAPVVGRYQEGLGGAISFDLRVDVPRPSSEELFEPTPSSSAMRDQVMAAQEFKHWRREKGVGGISTAGLPPVAARAAAVARTIADLEGCERIKDSHVLEAVSFSDRRGGYDIGPIIDEICSRAEAARGTTLDGILDRAHRSSLADRGGHETPAALREGGAR